VTGRHAALRHCSSGFVSPFTTMFLSVPIEQRDSQRASGAFALLAARACRAQRHHAVSRGCAHTYRGPGTFLAGTRNACAALRALHLWDPPSRLLIARGDANCAYTRCRLHSYGGRRLPNNHMRSALRALNIMNRAAETRRGDYSLSIADCFNHSAGAEPASLDIATLCRVRTPSREARLFTLKRAHSPSFNERAWRGAGCGISRAQHLTTTINSTPLRKDACRLPPTHHAASRACTMFAHLYALLADS